MKLTLSWLKDHLDTNVPLEPIVETLTKVGLEVEGVDPLGGKKGVRRREFVPEIDDRLTFHGETVTARPSNASRMRARRRGSGLLLRRRTED